MQKDLVCSSCKTEVTNSRGITIFKCPNCAKQEIVRCSHCKKIVAKYKCTNCQFEGPN